MDKLVVPILVHGANQSARLLSSTSFESQNANAWDSALQEAPSVLQTLKGHYNDKITDYHSEKNTGKNVPYYEVSDLRRHCAWYGSVWESHCANREPDGDGGFNYKEPLPGSLKDNMNLLDKMIASDTSSSEKVLLSERAAMDKFFAELVPFYELNTIVQTGKTLYGTICQALLEDIATLTDNGEIDYIIIAHSMGCAVSYNVLSHLDQVISGNEPLAVKSADVLSADYLNLLKVVSSGNGRCQGLLTFGNYIGYNYCSRLNNYILTGDFTKKYKYPISLARWVNCYTFLGGDPYIIDDKLGNSIEGHDGRFRDERVWRIPMRNIGHGRENWFKRSDFERDMYKFLCEEICW